MERKDWALLAIAAARGDALTPVQLQKSLFLLGQEFPTVVGGGYYKFAPYNYGPFDRDVYVDAEVLATEGLVALQNSPGQTWVEYRATQEGLGKAEQLRRPLDANVAQYITDVVAWTRGLSFQSLVRAIYAKYPHFRENSVFRG